jgi:flagellar biosynthesis chaperone FliJ
VKRYQFNLETVLRARKAQESIARADLLRANLMASAAEAAKAKSQEHYEEVVGSTATSFMQHRERSELAAKALIGSEESMTDANSVVEKALHDYVAAARAVSVLEHLDERRREEHAVAVAHEESVVLDELSSVRYGRAKAQANRAGQDQQRWQ